jgi:hypothetical protein
MTTKLTVELNDIVEPLYREISALEKELQAYKSQEKDRVATKATLFVLGLAIGAGTVFYALR